MKKITLFIVLLGTIAIYGQQRRVAAKVQDYANRHITFMPYAPLSVSSAPHGKQIDKTVNNATFAHLDKSMVQLVFTNRPQAIELSVPYNGAMVTMQLYRVEVLAKGFHAKTDKGAFNYNPGAYYRGIIKGDAASVASFNFFDGEMSGIASSAALNNLVVGHLPGERDSAAYIVYSDTELNILHNFGCGTQDLAPARKSGTNAQGTATVQTENCATVYFEIDNDIYIQNGSSQQATGNWLTGLFNNVQTLYDNDGINVSLKSFMVWTTQDSYSGSTSEDYLNAFGIAHLNDGFDGDVGQLLGIDPGGLGGLAVLEGLCGSPTNISYVDIDNLGYTTVPVYSWTVEACTHELGHLFGSPHTHACAWNGNNTPIDGCGILGGAAAEGTCDTGPIPEDGGTIMSYCHLIWVGINLANGFGPQPAQLIQNFVNSATCIGTACAAETCHSYITSLAVGDITADAATVSWVDETTGPWQVSYHTIDGSASEWQDATAAQASINTLLPNTYYIADVRTSCQNGTPSIQEITFGTQADWCSGQVLTDTGGANGGYPLNQHFIRTISPSAAASKIKIDFTSFSIESGYDFFKLYDGPDTNAPLLGTFTGSTLPGSFTSTAQDGSLTFEFTSDEQVTSSGWVATVTCEAMLATGTSTFTNLSYYPNPASGIVTIKAGEAISTITVYNATGQLLLSKNTGASVEQVDMSQFATGVYFFKVTGGAKQSNFTVIKQ